MAKKQHGGRRDGAGRKSDSDGPRVVIGASVPADLIGPLDEMAAGKGWNRSKAVTEAIRLLLKRSASARQT